MIVGTDKTSNEHKIGIIVFVKNPELGKVKTRLGASVGDKRALEIYMLLLEHTRNVLKSVDVARFTYYSEYVDDLDQWSNDIFTKSLQEGIDLGNRMCNAFEEVFQKCNKVIIIGSDCAQLKPDHIKSAIEALESNNVVIGPSLDGGYYLLGMDNFYPTLFQNIEWSTDSVLNKTLEIAKSKEFKVNQLEPLSDIDFIEDWDNYGF